MFPNGEYEIRSCKRHDSCNYRIYNPIFKNNINVSRIQEIKTKEYIKKHLEDNYFKLDKSVFELQESKDKVIIKCIDTAKASLICFFESVDYEDAIRNAISIGGDSDTIAAITGSVASAFYGIPIDIYNKGLSYLDDYLLDIHDEFIKKVNY